LVTVPRHRTSTAFSVPLCRTRPRNTSLDRMSGIGHTCIAWFDGGTSIAGRGMIH